MKKGNLEKWTKIEKCKNLLFFSQLVNELLFDYSIPSNRISTLNSHYLCLDALSAINGIETNGVPEGTLKPIMEEFYCELEKDPIFSSGNKPTDYFVKYQGDKYIKCTRISDVGYEELKNTALAINRLFFADHKYFLQLKNTITALVKNNCEDDQQKLFRLTKSLLTELKNSGYSIRYIYMVMNRIFWNPKDSVDNPDKINDFFSFFDFNKRPYTVVFKVKKTKVKKFIDFIDGLECRDFLPSNIAMIADSSFKYRKAGDTFLIIDYKAFDPYSAAESVTHMVDTNIAVFRLYDHNFQYHFNTAKCEIFDDKHVYKTGHKLKAVEHTKTPPYEQISESIDVVDKAMEKVIKGGMNLQDFAAVLNAIQYHSHSLDSLSEENQLLDLWSIFESVLDISNKHTSDRIQQVCMYLVPLLKQQYIYSLFNQLSSDIKAYNESKYNEIIDGAEDKKEIVKRVCYFTLLDSEKEKRETFLNSCIDFPLLKERIEYYNRCLKTPSDTYGFVEKHAQRVRWQIMRIYRNRNLIIHNGSKMSYMPLLIENLHSYVDDFLSYTIHCLAEGNDINSMCQNLFVKECKWNSIFQRQKEPIDSNQIDYILSL